jgi:hypothetical protein
MQENEDERNIPLLWQQMNQLTASLALKLLTDGKLKWVYNY